jgi:hypothetical protein
MNRLWILSALAAAGIATSAIGADSETIRPGYWESTNKAQLIISQTTTEKRCLLAKDVDKFLQGPSNRHYKCDYPYRSVGNGRLSFKGTCVDKKGRKVNVVATGSYSPDRFQITANLSGKLAGVPLSATFSTDARRIGDVCPPPPPKPAKK